jgi:hypothetical protein
VYFAYVSFLAALCQFTGKATETPAWLICLEHPDDIPPELLEICKKVGIVNFYGKRTRIGQHPDNVHPEFLNMFKKSHIVDFSGERTRTGAIIDVLKCDWISVADVLLKAKVPIWLYWGDHPWMVTPRAGWMADYKPQLVDLDLPSVKRSLSSLPPVPLPSQPQSPPRLSACEVIARRRGPRDQLPGETYQQYFIRRQTRNEAKMKTETAQDKAVRADRDRSAAGRQYPGRKGPAVYYWEPDSNGFRVRTLQTRAQAQKLWGIYSGPQKVFDSFANEWDCCTLFGDDGPDRDDDDIYPSTTSNVIPNTIGSTSGVPPHEEPTLVLPPPHEESTSSNLSLGTSLEDEAKSQGIPMDLDAQSLPYPPRNSPRVSPASSYHDHRPALSRRAGSSTHNYHRRHDPRDDSPNRYDSHRHNRQNSPGRYHERRRSRDMGYCRPYRDSRGDSPRRYHRNHSQDPPLRRDNPMRYHNRNAKDHRPHHDNPTHYHNSDLRDGGSRSMHRRSRSSSRGSYHHNSNVMVVQDSELPDDDLLTLSKAIVLSVHPPDPTVLFSIQTDCLEDHIYYRFGFRLDENPYTGVPSSAYSIEFSDWLEVRRSIGCQQVDSSLTYRQPIQDFLQILLSKDDPLRDVPAKFWDLNSTNSANLNLAAGPLRIKPKKFLDGVTRYLVQPAGVHSSRDANRDSSWVLAVDAMTALECVRRRLGPHTVNIADFLINRGIPFSTLRCMTSLPAPHTPPRPISNLLGIRPINYRFDVADFSAYQTLCDSLLKSKPSCRAALCMGGIVARLAREILPNTAALLGPSQDALEGFQKILVCGDECFCDDKLDDAYTDLICGVYKIPTVHRSEYTFKSV